MGLFRLVWSWWKEDGWFFVVFPLSFLDAGLKS